MPDGGRADDPRQRRAGPGEIEFEERAKTTAVQEPRQWKQFDRRASVKPCFQTKSLT